MFRFQRQPEGPLEVAGRRLAPVLGRRIAAGRPGSLGVAGKGQDHGADRPHPLPRRRVDALGVGGVVRGQPFAGVEQRLGPVHDVRRSMPERGEDRRPQQ
ncbi:hypothetical protein ABLI39_06095 [Pseudarthrobacter sp. B907]|uniref:hypothetical protein n=1 Tax=Pseudarthrobacter sp. B907 TaxID=3158261 RepID=UPI0032DBA019